MGNGDLMKWGIADSADGFPFDVLSVTAVCRHGHEECSFRHGGPCSVQMSGETGDAGQDIPQGDRSASPVPAAAPPVSPDAAFDPARCPTCGDDDRVGVFRRTVHGLVCVPCDESEPAAS